MEETTRLPPQLANQIEKLTSLPFSADRTFFQLAKEHGPAIALFYSLIVNPTVESKDTIVRQTFERLLDRVTLNTVFFWTKVLSDRLMGDGLWSHLLCLARVFDTALQRHPKARDPVDPSIRVGIIRAIASSYTRIDKPDKAVEYLEGVFKLTRADYSTRQNLEAKLDVILAKLNPTDQAGLVTGFIECLHQIGRDSDSLAALEVLFKIEDADYKSVELLERKLRARLKEFGANHGTVLFDALQWVWHYVGRVELANWIDEKYKVWSGDQVHGKQRSDPDVEVGRLIQRAQTKCGDHNYADALTYLAPYLPLKDEDFTKHETLALKLKAGLSALQPETAAHYVCQLCLVRHGLGQDVKMVDTVEAYLGVQRADYIAVDLAKAFWDKGCKLRIRISAISNLVELLIYALPNVGRRDDAAKLLRDWLAPIFKLPQGADLGVPTQNMLGLFEKWLDFFGKKEAGSAVHACRWFLGYMRDSVARSRLSQDDRQRFMTRAVALRAGIVATGMHWLREQREPDAKANLRREVLCWDIELGQRVLFEQFLLQPCAEPKAGCDSIPINNFPFSPAEAIHDGKCESVRSPMPRMWNDAPITGRVNWDAFSECPRVSPSLAANRFDRSPELLQAVEETLRQGVSPSTIARNLRYNEVYVRAGVYDDGSLWWSAWGREGDDLRLLAHDDGADDKWKRHFLALANSFYEFNLWLIWHSLSMLDHPSAELEYLHAIERCAKEVAHAIDFKSSPILHLDDLFLFLCSDGFSEQAKWLAESLDSMPSRYFELTKFRWKDLQSLANALLEELTMASTQRMNRSPMFSEWKAKTGWSELDLVVKERFANSRADVMKEETRKSMEIMTERYIDEVSRVWMLSALLDHSDYVNGQTDLLFQVDDVLHSIPMAYLDVNGTPLFQRVRSIRSSVSFLLTNLQRQVEKKRHHRRNPPNRILTVSHFDTSDPAQPAALKLYMDQRRLAEKYKLTHSAAAFHPAASGEYLANALRTSAGYRVVTVCGHGHGHKGGVVLQDGLWVGDGCDLSAAEFLVFVSCSLGRIIGSFGQDVNGFCVRLTANRAISVLACRRMVDSYEAVEFANTVISEYLRLREELPKDRCVSDECLRARALNNTRKAFWDGTQGLPPMTLNTATTVELYGLG